MKNITYPNLKQSILLLFFSVLIFSLFFFFTLTLPLLFEWELTPLYKSIITAVSPICWVPIIVYVSKKSATNINLNLRLPETWSIFLLIILGISAKVVTGLLSNPIEFLENLDCGRIKREVLDTVDLNMILVFKLVGPVLIVPIVEEIFFRKQLMGLLLNKYSPFISIILSSTLFAFLHLRFNTIGTLFIWGLIYGSVYYWTNSITTTIFLHSFYNFSNLFISYKFVNITSPLLLKFFLLLAVCLVLIFSILKYLYFNRVKNENNN